LSQQYWLIQETGRFLRSVTRTQHVFRGLPKDGWCGRAGSFDRLRFDAYPGTKAAKGGFQPEVSITERNLAFIYTSI
jgi:hypothetical protein